MSGAGIYIKTPSGLVAAATVPGVQGSQGPQSSLVPGTITTGAAGTNAAATITGAGPVQTLNLTIPRGNTGDPTAYELRGTGSPEGVVSAPVGVYYTDTAITNGAMRWAKKTGTGNTGWKCVEGDTGWRRITSFLNGWTGQLDVKRVNGSVHIRTLYSGMDGTSATAKTFMNPSSTFGPGFAPDSTGLENRVLWHRISGAVVSNAYMFWGAYWEAPSFGAVTDKYTFYTGASSWPTAAAWPTTLPGTAA